MHRRVVSGLMFFPRGGSAHVARALASALPAQGWDVTLVSGSLPTPASDARAFYAGLDIRAVDFAAGDAPMHPSFEDRPGAPDRCFAKVDDASYEEHVAAWSRALADADARKADVLHLHHLTPLNEAAARVAPAVPIVGHLHGTELLMLERIAGGPPPGWIHAAAWVRRMRRWAGACRVLLVPSPAMVSRAASLLGAPPAKFAVAPNGFDPELFRPREVDRAAFWRRHLVDEPRGWRPGASAGSVRYTAEHVARLAGGPVTVAVGRFTAIKRLPLLIRAFRRAAVPGASLVLVGGHPGEWEGEHPADVIAECGADDVFLAGWHDHDALAGFFNAADVVVLASVREQFGLVLVEGMACGLPAIAVDRLGPSRIVRDGRTGWLVEPDDEVALAQALHEALTDPAERRRRGAAARADALRRWSWPSVARDVARVLGRATGVRGGTSQIERTAATLGGAEAGRSPR
jgi:glycosyltransferase involved in cell wall biosynthesis